MELNFLESLRKHKKNDQKVIPKVLKSLKKIKTTADYEEYKETLTWSLFNWFISIQITAFLLFAAIWCLSAGLVLNTSPTNVLLLAEGISIALFLIIEFKKDLWRRT